MGGKKGKRKGCGVCMGVIVCVYVRRACERKVRNEGPRRGKSLRVPSAVQAEPVTPATADRFWRRNRGYKRRANEARRAKGADQGAC